MIRYYINGTNARDPNLVALARLALKAVVKDDVLVSITTKHPTQCIRCGVRKGEPTAIKVKGHTDVLMLCEKCNEQDLTALLYTLADNQRLDSVFLWEVGGVITMLTNALESEEIVDGKLESDKTKHREVVSNQGLARQSLRQKK